MRSKSRFLICRSRCVILWYLFVVTYAFKFHLNLIIKIKCYNNYIKLFINEKSNIKPHLQIVKVKVDGSFYVTNYKLQKNQFKKNILEGEIIYDLSSMSSKNSTDTNIITHVE